MSETKTCTCVPGSFMCPKAERAWRTYFELRDAPEGQRALSEYNEHVAPLYASVTAEGQGGGHGDG